MSIVSFFVVVFILWLIFFFIFLPLGIEIPEKHEFGHANSSPKKTYLFLKTNKFFSVMNLHDQTRVFLVSLYLMAKK